MEITAIITSLLTLLAGIGVFLLACQMMSSNLEAASSERLKRLFAKASDNKLLGVGIGALGTAAIQSSGATTVMTMDGTEIRFNAKGKWEKIDCKQSAVPAALIPTSIADHIHSHFPDMSIVKIEKKRYGYALAVSGDEELKFDKKGSLISTDE